ncbi:MAG: CHAD domain-containing protein [Usitatibacter sp.]
MPQPFTPAGARSRNAAASGRFFTEVMDRCLQQVLANTRDIDAGTKDEELVHQLRVGLRRLRTALRELSDFSPDIDPEWEVAFRGAFRALGIHRDAVTMLPALRKEMRREGIRAVKFRKPSPASRTPEAVVRDPQFQHALQGVMAFCRAVPPTAGGKGARRRLKKDIAARLARLHDDVKPDAMHFDKLSPSRQHRLRKRVKRMRYLAEFAAPLFDARRVDRYVKRWRAAQNELGDNHDYRVGLDSLRKGAPGIESTCATRWILARIRNCAPRCNAALRKAVKRPCFWED